MVGDEDFFKRQDGPGNHYYSAVTPMCFSDLPLHVHAGGLSECR